MYKIYIKPTLSLFFAALITIAAKAQYTETFENPPNGATVINSNGQSFTLTNSFEIFSSRAGYGYNGSKGFVDNSTNPALNQINSIKSTDGALFTVKNLWLYLSTNGGLNPSSDGSVIITGLKGGVPQYTINLTTGFSTSFVPNNGFGYFDFTNAGGSDNSNINIDELQFQIQGNFNYIALDNFTWAPFSTLPITMVSYNASLQPDGKVNLSWQTAYENNTSKFIIEKSTDAVNYKEVGSVAAAGNSSITKNYEFIDVSPSVGTNYYRLDEIDMDGAKKQLGIRAITITTNVNTAVVYPNPVTGSSFTLSSQLPSTIQNTYILTDLSGKIIQRGYINSTRQQVNVSQLSPGFYTIKLSDGEVIPWIKN